MTFIPYFNCRRENELVSDHLGSRHEMTPTVEGQNHVVASLGRIDELFVHGPGPSSSEIRDL
jgi:hypothetical protein